MTLLDRRNHHLFQPLLYQVATAALNPADIAQPIRAIVRKQPNIEVLLAEAKAIDAAGHRVLLDDGGALESSTTSSSPPAPRIRTSDTTSGRASRRASRPSRTRSRFASASCRRSRRPRARADPEIQREWLTFIVVGGGPTGVELAGAISEVAFHSLTRDFRRIDPRQARVLLLEAGPRLLPAFSPSLSEYAARSLRHMGVEVELAAR